MPVTLATHADIAAALKKLGTTLDSAKTLEPARTLSRRIGNHVLVGPRAYLSGCSVEECVFLAAGATVFNGAHLGARAEVRINGVVHIRTRVAPDAVVPIGWVAVGDPAEILPPGEHDRIWAIQEPLDFPGTVFGLQRVPRGESLMPALTRRYARALGTHAGDHELGHHASPDL